MDAPTDRASAPPPALLPCAWYYQCSSPRYFSTLSLVIIIIRKSHYLQFSLPDLAQKTFFGLFLFFSIHLDPTRRNWAFLRDLLDSFPLLVIYIIRTRRWLRIPPRNASLTLLVALDALSQRAQIPTTAARYPAHARERPFGIGVFLIDLIDYLPGRPGPARKKKRKKGRSLSGLEL